MTGLERSKRSRSGDGRWVYQRKEVVVKQAGHPAESSALATPIIQPTEDGDEARLLRHPRQPTRVPAPADAATSTTTGTAPAAPEQPTPTIPRHATIRRFHLSRSNSPGPAAGVSKKRTVPAVFIERGAKKQRESLKAIVKEHNAAPTADESSAGEDEPAASEVEPGPVQYKRPGTRASTTAPKSKPALPPSMRDRENTNVDELARAMDSWTIDEITKNLDRVEGQRTKSKSSPAKSRFRPKAPKLRYHERHPESLATKEQNTAEQQTTAPETVMDIDVVDTTDDEDYVLETYERVPAERLQDQAVPEHRVGLLVFDTEPEMAEFFYGNESDSEDEFPEDEEDENGWWPLTASVGLAV